MTALKIFSILLKPLEIVLLAIGLGFVAYFTEEYHEALTIGDPEIDPYDLGILGRYEFFLYTTGVGVAIAVFGLVCAVTGLLERKQFALAMFAVQAIWALQLLVSTALLAKVLTTYQRVVSPATMSTCEYWDKRGDGDGDEDKKYNYKCSQLTGGVVGGFGAMAAFGLDAIISLAWHIQSSQYSSL